MTNKPPPLQGFINLIICAILLYAGIKWFAFDRPKANREIAALEKSLKKYK